MTITASDLATRLDALLGVPGHPDYPAALNGLQVDHQGPVRGIAASVDVSQRVIDLAIAAGVNFLIAHHGLFWGGAERLVGSTYRRFRALLEHDIAVYAVHLPLDAHPVFGNNALLARELGLEVTGRFSWYQGVPIGVSGSTDLATDELQRRAELHAAAHGGTVRTSAMEPGRRTRRWAICTGAGASSSALREAELAGIDTLVVGEGPHHTAVEAPERGLVVIYAGHYATETLGVSAAAAHVSQEVGLPWTLLRAPTGL